MAEVLGARLTDNVNQSTRKIDMVPTIKELEPDATPLTVLSTRMPSAPTGNPEFSWVEDDLEPRFDAINNGAGYASGATSVVVDNGAYFAPDELWKVTRTAEVVRVTAVATNTLTIVRGIGSTAAAIVDNDELMKIGSASAENALSREARSSNPVKVTNYTQITRDSVEASETWRGSDQFTRPDDWDRQIDKAMIEHKLKLENTWLHGTPSENLTGAPLRTSGGALHFVQTNRTDMGGAMTETEFFGAFNAGFRYGNKTAKLALVSRLVASVLQGYPMGKLHTTQNDNEYGLNITKFVSPHGTLNIVVHDMLEGAVYGGYALVLDLSQLRKRPMKAKGGGTRDTHMVENIQTPGQDGRKDEILTEAGLEFGLEKTHFLMTGITI
jgi:hypothetical protein